MMKTMTSNAAFVERIETLSNEIQYLIEEIAELAPQVKDPSFVSKSEIWLNMFSEALEACNESIEEYNDYSSDPFENLDDEGEYDYDSDDEF